MSIPPRHPDTTPQARRNRRPHAGSIWPTRRDLRGSYVAVNRDDQDLVDVVVPVRDGSGNAFVHSISRGEARLLARRINECLDATVRR